VAPRRPEETSPRESGWEETRALGAHDVVSPSRPSVAQHTRIRVTRAESKPGRAGAEIGIGYLVERLSVGHPLRVAIEGAPAFVTTGVRGVRRLTADSVEVVTANSVYCLQRCTETESAAASEPALAARGEGHDSTSFVRLDSLRRPGENPFAEEARYRITRVKTRDPGAERLGELGTARILDRLEVGAMLRISVEGGPTLVTSPLRGLRRIDDVTLEADTANSTYRLRRLDPGT
jgi:hypothetical protein